VCLCACVCVTHSALCVCVCVCLCVCVCVSQQIRVLGMASSNRFGGGGSASGGQGRHQDDHIDQILAPLRQQQSSSSSATSHTQSSASSTAVGSFTPAPGFDGSKRFISSDKYLGSKPGYYFGTNDDGLGYHIDPKGPFKKAAGNKFRDSDDFESADAEHGVAGDRKRLRAGDKIVTGAICNCIIVKLLQ
jgi:hypothetical protein